MRKEDIIKSIMIGYTEQRLDMMNEDNPDYKTTFIPLPVESIETQYGYEFGIMMAREEMVLVESEMDNYIKDILYDSNSNLKLSDLV